MVIAPTDLSLDGTVLVQAATGEGDRGAAAEQTPACFTPLQRRAYSSRDVIAMRSQSRRIEL